MPFPIDPTGKLSIYEYENDPDRDISDFEKRKEVDYIIRGYKERWEEALEKEVEATSFAELTGDEYYEALQSMVREDWDELVQNAEEHGIWDPDHDYKYYGIEEGS